MRIQRNVEKVVIDYFRDKKIIRRLEYEIQILEESINELEECINNENMKDIEVRLENNKRKIIEKKLKLNDIRDNNIILESFFITLNKEDRELCELRYSMEFRYHEIGKVMHISNSTISRRLNNILMAIEM